MKYKLICLDMDGTLLNSNKEVTPKTKEAIKEAREAGAHVAICTGRPFVSAYQYAALLGIEAPIISANGAFIKDAKSKAVIYKEILGKKRCKLILDVLLKYEIIPNFHTPEAIFTGGYNKHYMAYDKFNKTADDDKKISIVICEDWDRLFNEYENNIVKCIAIDDDIDKVRKAKKELLELEELEVVSSYINNFEIMKSGVSKGSGAKKMAEFLGLSADEVICVGDNENDLSMIKYAGLGVCMENGEETVKKQADYITSSNDEDGIAEVINKFILSK
ncbi:Cof-type HAD-IIB family hydrolase [Clostridium oryzae]|uniref:Sugar phosphatase YidA n=1 Tax=Clostridium oryzae TaxID=1450648 RepID=A0A1V4I528_9CLOT|nr:Cof-type HAD-IIB family hydrolase [Clostridium oryzae]OPJ54677.1 sugar phosphatase YidA [Clostridium oryzae]